MGSDKGAKCDVLKFHRRYTVYLLLVFCVLILALVLLLARQYRLNVQYGSAALLNDFQEQVAHMEYLLDTVTNRVQTMRIRAEWDLFERRRNGGSIPPAAFHSLAEDEHGSSYHLDQPQPPITAECVGNLTGLGRLQGRGADFYRELHMALGLSPDFRATSLAIKDAAWIYYTSASDFVNIYPWVASTKFKFSKELHTHEFFTLGVPDKNPDRRVFWTEVYLDEYGKGLMTTCAAPVYDQDRFLGTVAIDLTVDFLNTIVKRFHPEDGLMFLVNDRGQVLAHPFLVTSADKQTQSLDAVLPDGLKDAVPSVVDVDENRIVALRGYHVIHRRIHGASWHVLYIAPTRSVPEVFVAQVGFGPPVLIVGLVVLVIAVLMTTHRKFVAPSGKLVEFIMRRSRRDTSVAYGSVPSYWHPWFQTIDEAFRQNEELAERIRGQNEELERRVAERTVSLEESNRALRIQFEERQLAEKEKERLQLQLQRAQKMEAIGLLAGGVAHDLNNVLTGLVSYPQLLLMQLDKESPLRPSVETIQRCGERAAAIVQDLLTLARRGVAVSEVVNLNEIVRDYLSSAEFKGLQLRHDQVRVISDLEDGLLNIMGSPVHLVKTVMNLVTNAAEAMTDGGIVRISTRNAYIDRPIGAYDEVQAGDYALLTVEDTGMGISTEDRERIFEPFYTKKVMGKSGTGLGMAVVWGTIKDHRGYVDVQSAPGEGTRFILYFPATREQWKPEKVSEHIEHHRGRGELVLIVDDVREQREIGAQVLERLNYRVDTAASGEEAVEYLERRRPDLILLDMIMDPGMDGLETYRKILEVSPGQKTILVSGFSETERVREAQRLGAGEYVKKPYLIETLAAAVRRALDS